MPKHKQKTPRFLALVLTFLMVFTSIPAGKGYAQSLSDINGHWAKSSIESLVDAGIVSGYPDGTFRPDNRVTRGEYVTMLNKIFSLTKQAEISFTDVNRGLWCYDAIAIAVGEGYASGYPDSTFRPNNPVTRAEAAVFIANIIKSGSASEGSGFADSIPGWAAKAIGLAASKGYFSGYPDGTFKPNRPITRAEAAVLLNKIRQSMMGENIPDNYHRDNEGWTPSVDPDEGTSNISGGGSSGGGRGMSSAGKIFWESPNYNSGNSSGSNSGNSSGSNSGEKIPDKSPKAVSAVIKDSAKDTIVITMDKNLKPASYAKAAPVPRTATVSTTTSDALSVLNSETTAAAGLKSKVEGDKLLKEQLKTKTDALTAAIAAVKNIAGKKDASLAELNNAVKAIVAAADSYNSDIFTAASAIYGKAFDIKVTENEAIIPIGKTKLDLTGLEIKSYEVSGKTITIVLNKALDYYHNISVNYNENSAVLAGETDGQVKTFTQKVDNKIVLNAPKILEITSGSALTFEIQGAALDQDVYKAGTAKLGATLQFIAKLKDVGADPAHPYQPKETLTAADFTLTNGGSALPFTVTPQGTDHRAYLFKIDNSSNVINLGDKIALAVKEDKTRRDDYNTKPLTMEFVVTQVKLTGIRKAATAENFANSLTAEIGKFGTDAEYKFDLKIAPALVDSDVLAASDISVAVAGGGTAPAVSAVDTSKASEGIYGVTLKGFDTALNGKNLDISLNSKTGYNIDTAGKAAITVSAHKYNFSLTGDGMTGSGNSYTAELAKVSGAYKFDIVLTNPLTGTDELTQADLTIKKDGTPLTASDYSVSKKDVKTYTVTINSVAAASYTISTGKSGYDFTQAADKTLTISQKTYIYAILDGAAETASTERGAYKTMVASDEYKLRVKITNYDNKLIPLTSASFNIASTQNPSASVTATSVTGYDGQYDLTVKGITKEDTAKITIAQAGYKFSPVSGTALELKIVKKYIDFNALPKEELETKTSGTDKWKVPKRQTDFSGQGKTIKIKPQKLPGSATIKFEFDSNIENFISSPITATSDDIAVVEPNGTIMVNKTGDKYVGELMLDVKKAGSAKIKFSSTACNISETPIEVTVEHKPILYWIVPKSSIYDLYSDTYDDSQKKRIEEGYTKGQSGNYKFKRNTTKHSYSSKGGTLYLIFQKDDAALLDNTILGNIKIQRAASGTYQDYKIDGNIVKLMPYFSSIDNCLIENDMSTKSIKIGDKALPLQGVDNLVIFNDSVLTSVGDVGKFRFKIEDSAGYIFKPVKGDNEGYIYLDITNTGGSAFDDRLYQYN